jgi:hypothetical protein
MHLFFIFRSQSEKMKNEKKEKYRCENHTRGIA